FDAAVDWCMRYREIVPQMQSADAGVALGHSQRFEDSVANKFIPALSGHRRNDLSGDHVEDVVISVSTSKTRCRFYVTEPANDFITRIIARRPPQQVTGAKSESASVREQIANRHLASDVRVVELKSRDVLYHRIIPGDFSFVDEHRKRRRSECLCV